MKTLLLFILLTADSLFAQAPVGTRVDTPTLQKNNTWTGSNTFTQAVTAPNIPASIPGAGSCTNQFIRALNTASSPTCATVVSSDLAPSLSLTSPTITSGVNVTGGGTFDSLNVTGANSTQFRSNIQLNASLGGNVVIGYPNSVALSTVTIPAGITDTFVFKNTTDTLTNKTLTSPTITSPNVTGGITADAITVTGANSSQFKSNIQINAALGGNAVIGYANSASLSTVTIPAGVTDRHTQKCPDIHEFEIIKPSLRIGST